MSANGYYSQQGGDLRATLAISQSEAAYGTTRMLNLPDGRVIPVTISPGMRSGQEIRLEGQGQQTTIGGPPGALILTVSIPTTENFGSQPYALSGTDTPTEFIAPPPPPIQHKGKYHRFMETIRMLLNPRHHLLHQPIMERKVNHLLFRLFSVVRHAAHL